MKEKKVVLCKALRTPIGHLAKSFAGILPEHLLKIAIEELIKVTSLDTNELDGVIIGWVGQGSHAPNIARISALHSGIPEKVPALTLQCNCVSGIESITEAARRIMIGEGELYIAGGTESMSSFPYAIRGARSLTALRTINTVKSHWDELWAEKEIDIVDCIEEGLNDPVKNINMAQTAEVCAQKYGISRAEQDDYTHETFSRCMEAQKRGFYKAHTVPVKINEGNVLDHDEYVFLREELVNKPEKIRKAPVLFNTSGYPFEQFYKDFGIFIDNKKFDPAKTVPSVTLFNSCARSDASAVIIVASEEKAEKLGFEISAEIRSWAFYGCNPAYMGISPALATPVALERAGINFEQIDNIELHEAFAATVLSAFKVGKTEFGHDWLKKWKDKKLNPNGGSIPLGHPLAATGTRLVLNLIDTMKENPDSRLGLAAACAAGGIGGAILIEKRT